MQTLPKTKFFIAIPPVDCEWVVVPAFSRERLFSAVLHQEPHGQGRPRARRGGGIYTPPNTRKWEKEAAETFRRVADAILMTEKLTGDLELNMWSFKKRPQRLCRKKDPQGPFFCSAKPDGDNIFKSVADSLVNAGIIEDDKLIVHWDGWNFYAEKGKDGMVVVVLNRLIVEES